MPRGWFFEHEPINDAIKLTMVGTYVGLVIPISSIVGLLDQAESLITKR